MNTFQIESTLRGEPIDLVIEVSGAGFVFTLVGVLYVDGIDVISLIHPDDIADLQMQVDDYCAENVDDFNPEKDAFRLGD